MAEKQQPVSLPSSQPTPPTSAARRGASSRGGDVDPIVELTERARIISQEAGTKVSTAMRDMISAAAGIAGFAVESARDLVQYMVRRGQMTQEEADRLIRDVEASHAKRPSAERNRPAASQLAADKAAAAKKAAIAAGTAPASSRPLVPNRMVAKAKPAAKKEAPKKAKPAARKKSR